MKGFRVLKRTKSQVLKDSAASATDYATALDTCFGLLKFGGAGHTAVI